MDKKRYQISPIELVQWAEPLFGEEGEAAKGFSEDLVSAYEASAGFKLPAALRGYLLACGRASLNDMLHPMHIPDKDAKPFGGNLTFSHDYIEGDMLGSFSRFRYLLCPVHHHRGFGMREQCRWLRHSKSRVHTGNSG